jgi:hypothetical protein
MYKTADILTLSQVTFMLPILLHNKATNPPVTLNKQGDVLLMVPSHKCFPRKHGYLHNTGVKHGIQPSIRETLLPFHRDVTIASPSPYTT